MGWHLPHELHLPRLHTARSHSLIFLKQILEDFGSRLDCKPCRLGYAVLFSSAPRQEASSICVVSLGLLLLAGLAKHRLLKSGCVLSLLLEGKEGDH